MEDACSEISCGFNAHGGGHAGGHACESVTCAAECWSSCGMLVELDGLLAVLVALPGDEGVPDDHVAAWFGQARGERKSCGDSRKEQPSLACAS